MAGSVQAQNSAIPVTQSFFSKAHASLVYQKVSQIVFSRWGVGLVALSVGIGACYGVAAAVGIGAIALAALYARTNFFLLDMKNAASRGDVEKVEKLLEANPKHPELTPQLIVSTFFKLSYAFGKEKIVPPSLDFLLDHPVVKSCSAKLGLEDSQSLKYLISLEDSQSLKYLITLGTRNPASFASEPSDAVKLMPAKNDPLVLWADTHFKLVLEKWSDLLCNDTITYFHWVAVQAHNEKALEILLQSDRVQDIAQDLECLGNNDAVNKKVLEVMLPHSGFAVLADEEKPSSINRQLTKLESKQAYLFLQQCTSFFKAIRTENVELAKVHIPDELTPFWISNAIALICKEERTGALQEVPSTLILVTLITRWKDFPGNKNKRLIEDTRKLLQNHNGLSKLFNKAFPVSQAS